MGSFGKGSLRKLCHSTLVHQSFLAAALIAALHCISSCDDWITVEWLLLASSRKSTWTFDLHAAAEYYRTLSCTQWPPPPKHCKLHFEKLRKFWGKVCGKKSKNHFYCASEGCGNVVEILRKFAELCGNFFGENSCSKCSAGRAQQSAHTSPRHYEWEWFLIFLQGGSVLGVQPSRDLAIGLQPRRMTPLETTPWTKNPRVTFIRKISAKNPSLKTPKVNCWG